MADAYVSQAQPRTNYGADPTLRIASSSKDNTLGYLQFETEGLPAGGRAAKITRATLKLFTLDKPVGAGVEVRAVTDTAWKEMSLNYANSPKVGDLLGVLEPGKAGWVSLDVTDLFASSESKGSYSLALVTSGNAATYASRETGDKAPQLVIEVSP